MIPLSLRMTVRAYARTYTCLTPEQIAQHFNLPVPIVKDVLAQ